MTASSPRQPLPAGFTLIELLVVIAIIAILAGLAFPAVQGALGSGKKAQARNDVHQLAAAIKAFQMEYGRLPSTSTTPDTAADNTTLQALIGSNAALNPRGIVFFEPKIAKNNKNGLTGTSYNDPWGNPYTIILDTDYNNRVSNAFTTVIVSSTAGSSNTNDIISNIK